MPTLDATQGGASANSYATVAEADAYLDNFYGTDEWTELSDDNKARFLIMATEFIEGLSVLYDPASDDQALKFPVETSSHSNGSGFAKATIACIRQAYYLSKHYESIQASIEDGIQGLQSQNLGGVSQTKFSANLNGFKRFEGQVMVVLAKFINNDFALGRA